MIALFIKSLFKGNVWLLFEYIKQRAENVHIWEAEAEYSVLFASQKSAGDYLYVHWIITWLIQYCNST